MLAGRFVALSDRNHFINRRAAVKSKLAEYLSVDPQSLRFGKGENGKPHLVDFQLEFSVSSAASVALLAVCRGGPVGIDICRRFSDPITHASGLKLTAEAWVKFEAMTKASGQGITGEIPDETKYEIDEFELAEEFCAAVARPRRGVEGYG